MCNNRQECQELSQPALKPGGNGECRKVRTGEKPDEKRVRNGIKTTGNMRNPTGFTWGWERVALLRCLFWERFWAYFPSRVYSPWSGKSSLRSMFSELSRMSERGGQEPRDGIIHQPTVKRVVRRVPLSRIQQR